MRDLELAAGLMPAGAVEQDDGMASGHDVATDLGEMQVRIDMSVNYINEYEADGLLINSIKSCNSFSAGQLLIMREVEKRAGKPAVFVESDLVDPRYFLAVNIKNRVESYFQMIEQKRAADATV